MLFNSYLFILVFLPITLSMYYLIKNIKIRNAVILLLSLAFYAYYNIYYLFIIIISIILNYCISEGINKFRSRKDVKKLLLEVGLFLNIGSLLFFKYSDFFISNINDIFKKNFNLLNIVLPLGISFFTFQQIAYIVDSYKGKFERYEFLDYALFVSFFPKLTAGPIVMHDQLIPQFEDKGKAAFNSENLYKGFAVFVMGLAKKVILADTFGKAVNWAWSYDNMLDITSAEVLIVMIAYTLQIYFDFSAYSDMAIGIAQMMNLELPMNFNSPYKSYSIPEFWQRWHISLTDFLRKYVYFPLGGSRKGTIRTYINILIVFLVSGIWHGANWTFIIWGLLHGILNCLTRIFNKTYNKLHKVTQWFITFFSVNLLWLLFRSDSFSQWIVLVQRLFKLESMEIRTSLLDSFLLPESRMVYKITGLSFLSNKIEPFSVLLWIITGLFICVNCKNISELEIKPGIRYSLLTLFLFVWSMVSISGVSSFIYYAF